MTKGNNSYRSKLMERYTEKFNLIPVVKGYPSDKSHGNLLKKCYGTFRNNGGLECDVLIEFYTNQPAYGIYYGCFVDKREKDIESKWEQIVLSIKRDFALYWESAQKADGKILEYDYIDNKGYWPFWIRLEDNEDIFEAIKNVQIIIKSLLAQGFSII